MTETLEAETLAICMGGKPRTTGQVLEVRSPADGRVVGTTFQASEADIDEAIGVAVEAFEVTRKLPASRRYEILSAVARGLQERREVFARSISDEAGKPLKDARGEVGRAILTFTTAAEEAKRIGGEWMPLDVLEATAGQWALIRRFPLGPIGAISPFNFPLNLVAHKLAPAIAAGNSVVLKPASSTPLTALRLAALLYECGLPEGALSVLPCPGALGERLVTDDRLKMITFTGSPAVGWGLKGKAGRKRVTLELGGNAGCVVHKDADINRAVARCAAGAFAFSGQSCISVQRIFVHRDVVDVFREGFVAKASALRVGPPSDESTDVGPMIDEDAARRAESWIQEAASLGARVLCGGKRTGAFLEPTVLADTRPDMKVNCQEVFAPVATIIPYDDVRAALAEVNDSRYGLQAGLFTRDIGLAFEAYETLDVGGLIVNEIPSYRVDPMPYGGVKDSGLGREGIRWTIQEMTEEKLFLYNPLGI